jgi:hypothetical protein
MSNGGPYFVDYCHGMVGGPAVLGPTGVRGFMQGPGNDQKAEALCSRLNAAWAELGETVEFLRAKRAELEARVKEVEEADRKTRDEFIEAWKAKTAAESRLSELLAEKEREVRALEVTVDDARGRLREAFENGKRHGALATLCYVGYHESAKRDIFLGMPYETELSSFDRALLDEDDPPTPSPVVEPKEEAFISNEQGDLLNTAREKVEPKEEK